MTDVPKKLGPNRRYPSLPDTDGSPEATAEVVRMIKEALEVGERRAGSVKDSYVRVRDLVDLGLLSVDEATGLITDQITKPGVYWDDMRNPASAINPPGLASDPDFDTTNGLYLFDSSATELLFISAQMPHGWKSGSGIVPHVHWQKTTSASGNVFWQLDYKKAPINEVMDASFTTLTTSSVVGGTPDTDTADKHLISSFGLLDMSDMDISDMLIFKLARIGGNAADTYGADARLLEFDIHYRINQPGSIAEFEKDDPPR